MVWWIGARLIDERERACDETVVARGHDRETYAAAILDVCQHYAVSPLRCAAGISGSDLKRRIRQIMRYQGMQSLRLTKKIVLAAAAAATLSIAMLAGLTIDGTVLAQEHPCVSMPATPRGPVMMTPADVEEGLRTGNLPDGGYLPVVKLVPRYPAEAAARRLQGYVIVDYTVGTDGSTEDVRVIESSSSLFEAAALETAARYQYKPCVMDGAPLAYPGVRTTIVFRLEGIDEPGPRALNRPLGETIIVTGQLPTNDENEG